MVFSNKVLLSVNCLSDRFVNYQIILYHIPENCHLSLQESPCFLLSWRDGKQQNLDNFYYTPPIVLRKVVSKRVYEHFLSLTVAISILLDSDDHKHTSYLDYAHQLLKYFVNASKVIYIEQFIVYNVHNLIHLSHDVRHFDCSLNDISAFPYENHLQTIKHLVRNAKNPVAQVLKRMTEAELAGLNKTSLKSSVTCISTKTRNCCFLLVQSWISSICSRKARRWQTSM